MQEAVRSTWGLPRVSVQVIEVNRGGGGRVPTVEETIIFETPPAEECLIGVESLYPREGDYGGVIKIRNGL